MNSEAESRTGPRINPKCPGCGRCIGVHWSPEREEYYCPSNSCQHYLRPRETKR